MEELCKLIYTYLEDGKQVGYGMLAKTILQYPPLLAFYSFLVIRWLVKKLSHMIHIFQKQ